MGGGLREARHSLYSAVPWLPRKWGIPSVAAIFFALDIAVIIVFAVNGAFHLDYYTYWNMILTTFYFGGVAGLYPIQGWWLAIFMAVMTPVAFGSAMAVPILVLIVIAVDDRLYIMESVVNPSEMHPISFSVIRTGDWIIHALPILQFFVLLLFGIMLYYQALHYHWERSAQWYRRIGTWAWNYIGPLILPIIYMCIFDPRKKYTDKLSITAEFFILVGVMTFVMTVFGLAVRSSQDDLLRLPDFYAEYLHPPPGITPDYSK